MLRAIAAAASLGLVSVATTFARGVGSLQLTPDPALSDLTTVSGVAALTLIMLGLLVKPFMDIWLCNPSFPERNQFYKPAMNIAAFTLAEGLSFLAVFAGVTTYEGLVTAFLIGLVAGASAVGSYEVAKGR